MTQKSSFFNSVNGDRKYNASDIAAYFSSFIGNGIYPNPSTNLQVTSAAGMNINITAGKAWINGYFYQNTSNYNITIDAADGVLKRIDRVVLRLDNINRQIILAILKGVPASAPVATALTRTADVYELALADILINNGDTAINQANITDQRMNATYCGIVSGAVDQIDTTGLFVQYDAEFNDWFETVKNTLSGDVAGNLQSQIDTLSNKVETHSAENVIQKGNGSNAVTITTGGNYQYMQGNPIRWKQTADSTGVVTLNVDTKGAKALKKLDGTAVNNLKNNKVYEAYFDVIGDCFFLVAKASGTAVAGDVLAGKTFSNDNDSDIVGAMPNRGTFNLALGASVPAGYYSGGNVPAGKRFLNGIIPTIPTYSTAVAVSAGFTPRQIFIDYTVVSFKQWQYLCKYPDGSELTSANVISVSGNTVYFENKRTDSSAYTNLAYNIYE